jgi:hypothetical protein
MELSLILVIAMTVSLASATNDPTRPMFGGGTGG